MCEVGCACGVSRRGWDTRDDKGSIVIFEQGGWEAGLEIRLLTRVRKVGVLKMKVAFFYRRLPDICNEGGKKS
jgi:hypothetical protein